MVVKLKWPWLGIAIPSFLISFIAYTSHYFVLRHYLSFKEQFYFEFSVTMIWISYYLAIITNPGMPDKTFKPLPHEWKNYCKKCNLYKPERAHHCKTCNQCILMMDHHCPWTMNCVGYKNFPHFLRFLFWVIATTSFLLFHLVKRIIYLWQNRNLPNYLFRKSELIALVICTPMDAFVLLTITLLLFRCLFNQVINGKTQIESWEMDRLESRFYTKKLVPQLILNLWEIYPESKTPKNKDAAESLLESKRVRYETIVNFPYDLNLIANVRIVLGSPLKWLWPWGVPSDNGMVFEKNEISIFEQNASFQDLLLALPWPPDGGRHSNNQNSNEISSIEAITKDGEQAVRNRNYQRNPVLTREEWFNSWGENLEDFGVDVNVE